MSSKSSTLTASEIERRFHPKGFETVERARVDGERRADMWPVLEHDKARARDARQVANEASDVLKKTYGASRVWHFGSVAERGWITPHSDIDLAVEGMAPIAHLEAVAFLEAFHPSFSIDLVRVEYCSATLRDAIEKQGILL